VAKAVHDAGGMIAIAHPQEYFLGNDRQRMDLLRQECCLDGIECAHLRVDPELTPIYRAYCRQHGLFSMGGSDSHTNEAAIEHLGRHGGDSAWLEEFLERIGATANR
jgi:predicted metal-dependent phosphoesterase TrpH